MDITIEELNEILKDYQNKPNKDVVKAIEVLKEDFEKTKNAIIKLTYHLDSVEELYNKLADELEKRSNG